MYSQNAEEKIILDYFRTYPENFTGILLDIGANDGKTFSNSLALIERGWKAILIEPDIEAFEKLLALHEGNQSVVCYNIAIANQDGEVDFYKSGTHLDKGDAGLLSTLSEINYDKWKSTTEFEIVKAKTVCFSTFMEICPEKKFDFITIDAEGMDWNIVSQMDLNKLGCSLICLEHNGEKIKMFNDYFKAYGLSLIHGNAENLIYGR
jgi:FkbM family methyltransferase